MTFTKLIATTGLVVLTNQLFGQNSVGIGTADSNPNAVLELVSPDNNQGILIPRLSTEHRLAMNANLSSSENGLMVFDSDFNQFFYWQDSDWTAVGSASSEGMNYSFGVKDGQLEITDNGGTLSIPFEQIEDNISDTDELNELQDLSLNGTALEISMGAGVDLAPILASGGTDDQNLVLNGDLLEIEDGDGTQIDLSNYVDDADANPTNEIQDLTFDGNIIALSNDPGNTLVDLSNYDKDVDDDFDGVFSSLTGIPSGLSDGDDIDDADADALNEVITSATLETGSILRLVDAAGNHDVDLSSLDNTSPWNVSGSDINYLAGNVGIGLTTPMSELAVFSSDGINSFTLATQNTNESSEILLGENAAGTLGMKLKYDGSANKFQLFGYSTGDIGPHLEVGRSGNVSINTTLATPSNGTTTITGTSQSLFSPSRRFVKITASLSGRGIQSISGGEDGKEVIIANVSGTAITMRNRATTAAGYLALKDNVNFTMYRDDTIHLIYDSTSNSWLEIGRGDNHGIIVN